MTLLRTGFLDTLTWCKRGDVRGGHSLQSVDDDSGECEAGSCGLFKVLRLEVEEAPEEMDELLRICFVLV